MIGQSLLSQLKAVVDIRSIGETCSVVGVVGGLVEKVVVAVPARLKSSRLPNKVWRTSVVNR